MEGWVAEKGHNNLQTLYAGDGGHRHHDSLLRGPEVSSSILSDNSKLLALSGPNTLPIAI